MMRNDAYQLGVAAGALGGADLGIIVLDGERRVVLWNRWMARHAGVAAETVIGQEFAAVFPDLNNKRIDVAIGQALRDGFPAVLSQTLHKAPFPLYVDARARNERMQQAVAVTPIAVAGSERHCLIQITDVTVAVNREQLLRQQALELRSQTFSDGLTGIANRRHFDVAMEKEVRRAKRGNQPLSLLMIDIDCFKAYNDHYGHQQGDDCLIKVAHALSSMLHRPTDLIARYGGEEFGVILPEMDAQQSRALAETMRLQIAQLGIPHTNAGASQHVTVSVGVATQTPEHPVEAVDLIGAADRALYMAKRTGRDRVVVQIP